MAQDRPTATELIDAVRDFLEQEVMEHTEGRTRFHARVAANVLRIVGRELGEGSAFEAAERERLRNLLGEDGSLEELNRKLSSAIRSGRLDGLDAEVLHHLRRTTREKLLIANPEYLPGEDAGD